MYFSFKLQNVCYDWDRSKEVTTVCHKKIWSTCKQLARTRHMYAFAYLLFSLSHARDKMKKIILYFLTEFKTHHISYSMIKYGTEQTGFISWFHSPLAVLV